MTNSNNSKAISTGSGKTAILAAMVSTLVSACGISEKSDEDVTTAPLIPNASIVYRDMFYDPVTKQPSFYRQFRWDDTYTFTGADRFNAPGPDGIWLTSDDVLEGWYSYQIAADKTNTGYIYYTGKGADNAWYTADDVIFRTHTVEYIDSDGGRYRNNKFRIDAGADGTWDTADDVGQPYYEYRRHQNGAMVSAAYRTDAGPDGLWFNDDDTVDYSYYYYFDSNGNLEKETAHWGADGPGADGLWLTNDDPIWYQTYRHFSTGPTQVLTREELVYSVGLDGLWNNVDGITYYYNYLYNGDNLQTRRIGHWTGPDGIAYNADDTVTNYQTYDYTSNGDMSRELSYTAAGADGNWFTHDDTNLPSGTYQPAYSHVQYNDQDLPVYYFYNYFGPDGLPFTADDSPAQYTKFDYDDYGNIVSFVSHDAPGPDGIWFTDDDRSNGWATYIPIYSEDQSGKIEIF
ncbi:MAG: hypothetical protein OEZ10_06550 [Gammaproteobacteria bacterium]|nr:hypothetical protein [Gammaproteobacteria bacterium]